MTGDVPPSGPPAPDGYLQPPQFTPPAPPASAASQPSQAQAPHYPGSVAPQPPAAGPKVLAIATLIVGIVAFLMGWVPVAGIIVGLIGVVLAIVAIVKKQPAAFAVTGLVLSAIAVIVSLVATILAGVVTGAVVDRINDQTEVSIAPTEPADNAEEAGDDATAGTRENPVSLGTLISGAEYDVTVNSFNPDATADVVAANSFNGPPSDGMVYSLLNVTITYTGADSGFASFARVAYVAASGEVHSSIDNIAVAPEPTVGFGELYAGGSVTGNIVIEIPAGSDGLIRVTPGLLAGEVFVATS